MPSTQRVKISGDGAKMSRLTNFVILSFSLLSDGEKVMSTKGKIKVTLVRKEIAIGQHNCGKSTNTYIHMYI
jgi:hypothetical protein